MLGVDGIIEGVEVAAVQIPFKSVQVDGVLAELHMGASAPSLLNPCEFVGLLKCVDDVVQTPLNLAQARVSVPDTPGLGAEIDPDKLRKYRLSPP